MRQVPERSTRYSYLIVGNGKLSKHFQNYFSLKDISYTVWTRNSENSFHECAKHANKILLLINDDEIEKFITSNLNKVSPSIIWIHCSGMLSLPSAESAHPLMSFTNELFDLQTYEAITFITEKGKKNFKDLFPMLNNPSYKIRSDDKILYHAFCVMSGNFTTMLWQFFFDFLKSINVPSETAYIYLDSIVSNLKMNNNPLTGPFQRKDFNTINKHLKILENHQMKNIYTAFLDLYNKKEQDFEIYK